MRADRRLHLMFFKRKLFFWKYKKKSLTFTKCEDQSSPSDSCRIPTIEIVFFCVHGERIGLFLQSLCSHESQMKIN